MNLGNHIWSALRRKAGQMACHSPLYNWSLRGDVPDHLIVKPVDAWPGEAEKGQEIFEGQFVWTQDVHGFEWMRDLRAFALGRGGGADVRAHGRAIIAHWAGHYPQWHEVTWRGDITGRRVSMWISHYDCFGTGADEEFQDVFFESLAKQARHLARNLPGNMHGTGLLQAIKGLLYCGLAFEGRESWIAQALDLLAKELPKQILGDGGHVSRSPAQLLEALQVFIDIRSALNAGGYPVPEKLQHAIDRMTPAVKFFRYNDRHFGLFNGTQETRADYIDAVLTQAGTKAKALHSLPCTGYEKLTLGRSMIVFDCGKVPSWPYDARAHAAPLSFEFSYGKERLFVNCGTHPDNAEWQEALRATPAHNTLTIDNRNAYEIRPDGHFGRKARSAVSVREDSKNASLVEGSHDGYMSLNGMTHRRRLYLSEDGHDLRGEDILSCAVGVTHPSEIAIRFHIHPGVMVSLVRDGAEALLRMPGGVGWRFHHAGGILSLEESIYLGDGTRPRKTKQIVIHGLAENDYAHVKWALQKEGA